MIYSRRQTLRVMGGTLVATALMPACSSLLNASDFEPTVTGSKQHTFLHLSSILTGHPPSELAQNLAQEYMKRLDQQAPGVLDNLLDQFRRLIIQSEGNVTTLILLVDKNIWRPKKFGTHNDNQEPPGDQSKTSVRSLARDIPLLWYAGVLMEKTSYTFPTTQFVNGSSASYLGALAWKVAGSHAPAECGGKLGYWALKPA